MVAAGGVGDLVPGQQATVDLDLAAGDDAFVCFLPDGQVAAVIVTREVSRFSERGGARSGRGTRAAGRA